MNSLVQARSIAPRADVFSEIFAAVNRAAPVLLLAAGVFLLRWPSFSFDVINVDESVYHLMGQAWLHGTPPHLGIVDNKPLGLYGLHAVAGLLFADPIAGARLLAAIATFAAAWLLARTAETFLGVGRWGGMVCGLLFSGYAILLGGDASQGPVFYAPMLAGGALLIMTEIAALNTGKAPSVARLGAAGLLLGLSLQIKYVTVFECASFGLFYLHAAWHVHRRGAHIRVPAIAGALVLIAGGLAPTLAAIGYYAALGQGATFMFYTFTANATRAMTHDPLPVLASRVGLILFALAPLMAPGIEYLRGARSKGGWVPRFMAAWFAAAMVGGAVQLQFADHYFYEAVLPLALMAAAAIHGKGAPRRAVVTSALLLGMALTGYVGVRSLGVDNNGGKHMPSIVARDITAVGAHSMYVFNSHTLLHLLTGIPLPTRYPLADHLIRDINAESFGFDGPAEMARVLNNGQDVIVVSRPINPDAVSPDRRKLLEDKLAADYCLWRQYPAGGHHLDVHLRLGFTGSDTCVMPQKVAMRDVAGPRTFPQPSWLKGKQQTLMARLAP